MELRSKSSSLLDLLNCSSEQLTEVGISCPRLNAEMLLTQTLSLDRAALYLESDRMLTDEELDRFRTALRRRMAHEPLQYVLGRTEFMSLPFRIEPGVLIPRPETEILVETALSYLKAARFHQKKRLLLLDLGTGSGCIAISLARYLPKSKLLALDVSPVALRIAAFNAFWNRVPGQIDFVQSNLLSQDFCLRPGFMFDAIISNPPYVSSGEYAALPREIRQYEPANALTDGADGFTFYKKIARLCRSRLHPGGFVALEVGMGQAHSVAGLLRANRLTNTTVTPDLNGIERVVIGRR